MPEAGRTQPVMKVSLYYMLGSPSLSRGALFMTSMTSESFFSNLTLFINSLIYFSLPYDQVTDTEFVYLLYVVYVVHHCFKITNLQRGNPD